MGFAVNTIPRTTHQTYTHIHTHTRVGRMSEAQDTQGNDTSRSRPKRWANLPNFLLAISLGSLTTQREQANLARTCTQWNRYDIS